ncbi:zinc-binding dehydrogenase [Pseudofrankia sp. BMG5.36]|uniref:zinc-binding dehydrogenase n=2 Tax=unclassified Pseudofrankia TaxID=2994372 RepID=UPI0008DAD4E1|nr:zinc-binding dehydrogenase [Pseudofrankia sp. BMG5.36]OHV44824.1 hypothetical protein BCD48_24195 [Pseudofrankia sp. BMG5.36]
MVDIERPAPGPSEVLVLVHATGPNPTNWKPSTLPMPEEAARLGVQHRLMLVEAGQGGMLAVADLARAGQLRPIIEANFPWEQAAKAHELGDTGRTTGKLVLVVS